MAKFAYNNYIHTSTYKSPFFAAQGYHPHTVISQLSHSGIPRADNITTNITKLHEDTQSAICLAQETMKRHFDRHVAQQGTELSIGNKVWLDAKNVTTTAPSNKLADKRLGLFKIIERISPLTYKLELPLIDHIYPVFHISLLEPYIDSSIPDHSQDLPPPGVVKGELKYKVETILNARLWRNQKQYLIKWLNYLAANNSWERATNLANAGDAIRDFHDHHPDFDWTHRKQKRDLASSSKVSSDP
jgi:hypothetical protein